MTALDRPRILLVDDHAAIRQGLAQVLTEEAIGECREAAGGRRYLRPQRASLRTLRWWTSCLAPTTPCNW